MIIWCILQYFFLSQEKRYNESCAHFNTVLQVQGYRADTCYCIALCHYNLRQYATALKYITEIIERGIKDHPGTVLCLECIHTGENFYQFCHVPALMDGLLLLMHTFRIECWNADRRGGHTKCWKHCRRSSLSIIYQIQTMYMYVMYMYKYDIVIFSGFARDGTGGDL